MNGDKQGISIYINTKSLHPLPHISKSYPVNVTVIFGKIANCSLPLTYLKIDLNYIALI
jgi:hypothetical protein